MLPPLVRFIRPNSSRNRIPYEQAEHDAVDEVQRLPCEERFAGGGKDGVERTARRDPAEGVGAVNIESGGEQAVVERPRQHGQSDGRKDVAEERAHLRSDQGR